MLRSALKQFRPSLLKTMQFRAFAAQNELTPNCRTQLRRMGITNPKIVQNAT